MMVVVMIIVRLYFLSIAKRIFSNIVKNRGRIKLKAIGIMSLTLVMKLVKSYQYLNFINVSTSWCSLLLATENIDIISSHHFTRLRCLLSFHFILMLLTSGIKKKKKKIQLSIQRQGLILQIKLICPLFSSFTLSYDTVYLLTIMLWNTRFNYLISGLTQESMVMVVSKFCVFFFWMHSKLLIISECTFWLSYLVVWKKVADLPGDIFLAISFPSPT